MIDLKFKIERMTAEHLPEVAAIERETNLSRWGEKGFLTELSNADSILLVARLNEIKHKTIGFVFARLITPEMEIINIAVDWNFRGKNIGSELLKACLSEGLGLGAQTCWLEVRESNQAAIRLYEKHGFVRVGLRKNYYSDTSENALLFDKKIEKSLSGIKS